MVAILDAWRVTRTTTSSSMFASGVAVMAQVTNVFNSRPPYQMCIRIRQRYSGPLTARSRTLTNNFHPSILSVTRIRCEAIALHSVSSSAITSFRCHLDLPPAKMAPTHTLSSATYTIAAAPDRPHMATLTLKCSSWPSRLDASCIRTTVQCSAVMQSDVSNHGPITTSHKQCIAISSCAVPGHLERIKKKRW